MTRLSADALHPVTVVLNGETVTAHAEPRRLLSDFLRHDAGAYGVHVGCEHGVCGACTVRVDGVPTRACLMYAVQADGARVETVEGLGKPGRLNRLQRAFKRNHALQCGYCTPGILMSLTDYLEREPAPTEAGVREVLSGHLCRCTGYTTIVRAALEAAAEEGVRGMLDLGRSFAAIVERDPTRLAIVDGERAYTYGAWQARILGVLAGLREVGLRPGDHLVAVMQNREEMATLHWACQVGGVVITPLNWRAKAAEIDHVLADADARAVVFDPSSAQALAGATGAAAIPRIAAAGAEGGTATFDDLAGCPPAPLVPAAGPADPSLMLYTSGTTGPGKGVPRSHRAERAAGVAHVAQNRYGYGERTLGAMPLYHAMGVRSLLAMGLVNGLFVCQPRFEAGNAIDLIEAHGLTNLYLVPTLYHDLLAHPAFARERIATVRKLGFAGAPMTDGLLRTLVDAFAPELFVNHYGSSEIYTFTVEPDAPAKPGSAGKAGINQRIRVVQLGSTDPDDRAAPGEEGQIVADMAGDESFTGYWRRPDADRKSLHAGWYFTGDTGCFDAAGDLFVTGRVDDLMVSGGENITPVEIESVLSLHPGVAEVAVVGLPDERLGQKVTAFVTPRGDVSAETLDRHCRDSALADFKRPREYVFVCAIPKSPVGKILRRMLIAGEYECVVRG